jgi:hypothetical protein
LSTADLFKFPNFETICWYVGKHILDIFRGMEPFTSYPICQEGKERERVCMNLLVYIKILYCIP